MFALSLMVEAEGFQVSRGWVCGSELEDLSCRALETAFVKRFVLRASWLL